MIVNGRLGVVLWESSQRVLFPCLSCVIFQEPERLPVFNTDRKSACLSMRLPMANRKSVQEGVSRICSSPGKKDNEPSYMLLDYPGPGVYSSKQVAPRDRLEIILDPNRIFSLSRLTLVCGDDSFPEQWSVDISLDGETWKTRIQGTNTNLDTFSWRPGYEFYGAEPVQACVLRYTPAQTQDRFIRLRFRIVGR